MDDAQVHARIEQFVAEEHDLWQREADGTATEVDRERLRRLEVQLDQTWDLLRQRRALRSAGKSSACRFRASYVAAAATMSARSSRARLSASLADRSARASASAISPE